MKANKVHKRLAKIEELISDVSERYSSGASHIREALQDAKAAFARVKEAISSPASSGESTKAAPAPKKAVGKKKAAKKTAAKNTDPAPVKKTPAPAQKATAPVRKIPAPVSKPPAQLPAPPPKI